MVDSFNALRFKNNRGCSIVCVNTLKGLDATRDISDKTDLLVYSEVLKYNPAIVEPIDKSSMSARFWMEKGPIMKKVKKISGDPFSLKLKKKIRNLLVK